jgi:Tol biopolymer transport system component
VGWNPDGSAQRRLFAKKGSGGLEGTFAPTDADLMFFTRFKEKPFSDDIYRGSLATGEVARVIGGRSADLAPTVSPDGTKIAFPPPDTQEQAKPRSALVAGRNPVRLPGGSAARDRTSPRSPLTVPTCA